MLNKALFSSNSNMWETPQVLFNELNKEFNFTIDVCATKSNAKCENFFSPKEDGLLQDWSGMCWMNPPYGKSIKHWVEKAFIESRQENCTVVALLPARTDTKWFHNYIYHIAEIRFLKGRLKFSNSKNAAPFPSMIVIWR